MRWLSAGLAGALQAATGSPSVDQDHDFDAFANPSATDAIAATLGFGKSAIDEVSLDRIKASPEATGRALQSNAWRSQPGGNRASLAKQCVA